MVEEDKQCEIDEDDFKKKEEEWLVQCPLENEYGEKLTTGSYQHFMVITKCFVLQADEIAHNRAPTAGELDVARKKREHHKKMVETLQEIGTYILYVILLLIATNVAKDPHSFLMRQSVDRIFLQSDPLFEEVNAKYVII